MSNLGLLCNVFAHHFRPLTFACPILHYYIPSDLELIHTSFVWCVQCVMAYIIWEQTPSSFSFPSSSSFWFSSIYIIYVAHLNCSLPPISQCSLTQKCHRLSHNFYWLFIYVFFKIYNMPHFSVHFAMSCGKKEIKRRLSDDCDDEIQILKQVQPKKSRHEVL